MAPTDKVSSRRGKKAARAAPMSALAAMRACFRLLDVGPVGQQVRRQSRRQLGQHRLLGQGRGRRQVRRRLRAEQQGQAVAGLGQGPLAAFQIGFGGGDLAFGLGDVQAAALLGQLQLARQVQGLAPVRQGQFGQAQLFFRQALGEIGLGHGADETEAGRPQAVFAGQVAGEGGFREGADAAKEVHLEGADAQAGGTGLLDGGAVAAVAGAALARAFQPGIDAGHPVAALDVVLGLHLGDVEHGQAQVPVVFQGHFDQALQARIAEHAAPADGGGRSVRRFFRRLARRGSAVGVGHGQGRLWQRRRQGTAAEGQEEGKAEGR